MHWISEGLELSESAESAVSLDKFLYSNSNLLSLPASELSYDSFLSEVECLNVNTFVFYNRIGIPFGQNWRSTISF